MLFVIQMQPLIEAIAAAIDIIHFGCRLLVLWLFDPEISLQRNAERKHMCSLFCIYVARGFGGDIIMLGPPRHF